MEIEEETNSDANFYNRCWKYIQSSDNSLYNYFSIQNAIESYIRNEFNLKEYVQSNIFFVGLESDIISNQVKDSITESLAIVYKVCFDKGIKLSDSDDFLIKGILDCLTPNIGIETAAEVMHFLENYEE